ncbi:MAG: response regulator transcription factor [Acidobacteriia bacterium]|nr:response regulator transcription factor [Terriglobia bacterium]
MRELKEGAVLARRPSRFRFSVQPGRIIVASNGAAQRKELRIALELEGHRVTEAETADRTLQETGTGLFQLLLLDSELKGLEPSELCRAIRPKSDLGIIVLAGDDTRQDRIDALNAGADDYVASPFVLPELLARVRAVLRRVTRSSEEGRQIVLEDRAIDLRSHKIKGPGDRVIHLTPKEFLVLKHLVSHANRPLTHQSLAQSVWQRDAGGELEYLRIVIKQLRRKLEPDPDNPQYIRTERSVGYRFDMPPTGQGATEPYGCSIG